MGMAILLTGVIFVFIAFLIDDSVKNLAGGASC